jgi:hypothetical protein
MFAPAAQSCCHRVTEARKNTALCFRVSMQIKKRYIRLLTHRLLRQKKRIMKNIFRASVANKALAVRQSQHKNL